MIRPLITVACCAALLVACQPLGRQSAALPDSEWSSDRARHLTRPNMTEGEPERE